MKKTLTLNAAAMPASSAQRHFTLAGALRALLAYVENSQPVVKLAALYSLLLEEHVTPRRTLRLAHAQIAGLLLIGGAGSPLPVVALLTAWTAAAVYHCRKA